MLINTGIKTKFNLPSFEADTWTDVHNNNNNNNMAVISMFGIKNKLPRIFWIRIEFILIWFYYSDNSEVKIN